MLPKGFIILCCIPALSRSAMSDSLQLYGLRPARVPYAWDSPGKNTTVVCHFLLQGIFLIQGLNRNLLHWQVGSLPLNHQGNPVLYTTGVINILCYK